MWTVWKYKLPFPRQKIDLVMPVGANLVHFAKQGIVLCVWARVEPGRAEGLRRLMVLGTGLPVTEEYPYSHVGTCEDGEFIWHLFDGGYV